MYFLLDPVDVAVLERDAERLAGVDGVFADDAGAAVQLGHPRPQRCAGDVGPAASGRRDGLPHQVARSVGAIQQRADARPIRRRLLLRPPRPDARRHLPPGIILHF